MNSYDRDFAKKVLSKINQDTRGNITTEHAPVNSVSMTSTMPRVIQASPPTSERLAFTSSDFANARTGAAFVLPAAPAAANAFDQRYDSTGKTAGFGAAFGGQTGAAFGGQTGAAFGGQTGAAFGGQTGAAFGAAGPARTLPIRTASVAPAAAAAGFMRVASASGAASVAPVAASRTLPGAASVAPVAASRTLPGAASVAPGAASRTLPGAAFGAAAPQTGAASVASVAPARTLPGAASGFIPPAPIASAARASVAGFIPPAPRASAVRASVAPAAAAASAGVPDSKYATTGRNDGVVPTAPTLSESALGAALAAQPAGADIRRVSEWVARAGYASEQSFDPDGYASGRSFDPEGYANLQSVDGGSVRVSQDVLVELRRKDAEIARLNQAVAQLKQQIIDEVNKGETDFNNRLALADREYKAKLAETNLRADAAEQARQAFLDALQEAQDKNQQSEMKIANLERLLAQVSPSQAGEVSPMQVEGARMQRGRARAQDGFFPNFLSTGSFVILDGTGFPPVHAGWQFNRSIGPVAQIVDVDAEGVFLREDGGVGAGDAVLDSTADLEKLFAKFPDISSIFYDGLRYDMDNEVYLSLAVYIVCRHPGWKEYIGFTENEISCGLVDEEKEEFTVIVSAFHFIQGIINTNADLRRALLRHSAGFVEFVKFVDSKTGSTELVGEMLNDTNHECVLDGSVAISDMTEIKKKLDEFRALIMPPSV